MDATNESAKSLKWLRRHLSLDQKEGSSCHLAWTSVCASMRATTQIFGSTQDWISDFWLCKSTQVIGVGLPTVLPLWSPPDEIDGWAGFPETALAEAAFHDLRSTNYASFSALLSSAVEVEKDEGEDSVAEFYRLIQASTAPRDLAMLQAEHVRAWLTTALGNLLSSIVLSPQNQHDLLVSEAQERLELPRELKAAPLWGIQFGEGQLGILYNCSKSPKGDLSWGGIRIGQGEEWLRHWQWLSAAVHAESVLPALRLAAKLLRSKPLLEGLLATLTGSDVELRQLALAVMRRWLLSLQAMAWLENALQAKWNLVRAQDLACLAFNAVKPDWPRRSIAVSHRSMDAKPLLQQMRAWKSSLFGIDANYAPSWETNVGMIWGLFAAAPVIARVESANYKASEWCERESEMIRYLETGCDFLPGRSVLDVDVSGVSQLDGVIELLRPPAEGAPILDLPEFPPLCQIHVSSPQPEWVLAFLRAAAALRVMKAVYRDGEIANKMGHYLVSRQEDPPVPPPTNEPGGWSNYRKLFRDLHQHCGLDTETAAISIPSESSQWDGNEAQILSDAIPDLSSGKPTLFDVLAALEWRFVVVPLMESWNTGDMTLIDLRGLSRAAWEGEPSLSLGRGIAALRATPRPIWFIQDAGQRVDEWNLPYDRPVFTEYNKGQYAWMMETTLALEWTRNYADACGLAMHPALLSRCNGNVSGVSALAGGDHGVAAGR